MPFGKYYFERLKQIGLNKKRQSLLLRANFACGGGGKFKKRQVQRRGDHSYTDQIKKAKFATERANFA